jgi:hypothetical protein
LILQGKYLMKVFSALALGTACSISLSLFGTVQPASAVPEVEPNNSFGSPQLLPAGTDTINGSISPSDVDFFTFSGINAGSRFRAEITSGTFDSILGFLDDSGNILDTDDDSGAGLLSLLSGIVPASGNLNLAVTGFADFGLTGAHGQSGPYTLSLETLSPNPSGETTLTFDELPFQPVDNLSLLGVTFDFKVGGVDSTDAIYGAGGPGTITFVQDPSLEGNAAGILTLDFTEPTSLLNFGVALSTFGSLTPGFTVELFDPALMSLGITPVNTSSLLSFTEGLFTYSGAPVTRAVIDFNETAAGRFALDNLTFGGSQSVPEPTSTLGVLAFGAFGGGSLLKRKRQQKA